MDDFATTGLHVVRPCDTPISRFQVLGERSSGTNFVKRLLGRNTALTPTEALGWKHGFPHATAIPPDLAVIACVRHAGEWALSMHRRPWHTTPALQALDFPTFIRTPWDTVIDRTTYFQDADLLGSIGAPLQHDRHPISGARFANLFALRRAKLNGLLSYLDRGCTVALVRMEDAQKAPEEMANRIATALGQPARDVPFAPVYKRLGTKFVPLVENRPRTPRKMGQRGRKFMRQQLDLKVEARLGYTYG